MAIPWIKFEVTTSDKMEVGLIADILGIDPDAVVGKLLRIWAWFDENTIDGNASVTQKALQERYKCNASSVAKALLDRRVGVVGFCDAMIQVGWMVELDGTISLPNFDRHNGESAKKRAEGGKRVEKHRNGRNAKSVTDVTQNTLPDKIREDKNIDTHTLPSDDPNGLIGQDVIVPTWMREWFVKWLDWRWHDSGKKPPATLQQTWIIDLNGRGEAKAIEDLQFSIKKQAKNLLRSENDFDKQIRTGGGVARPEGKLSPAERTRKIFEDLKNESK
jgi:hypothetical protein